MDPVLQALLDWLAHGTPPPGSYVPGDFEQMMLPHN